MLGDVQPIHTAKKNAKNKSFMLPYNYQQKYFLLIAPLILPIFFYVITVRHAFKYRLYLVSCISIYFNEKNEYIIEKGFKCNSNDVCCILKYDNTSIRHIWFISIFCVSEVIIFLILQNQPKT